LQSLEPSIGKCRTLEERDLDSAVEHLQKSLLRRRESEEAFMDPTGRIDGSSSSSANFRISKRIVGPNGTT